MSEDNFNGGYGESGGNGMAIASMVLGIVAIVLMCCNTYIGMACAVVGLILGILHVRKNGKNGMAIAGIVCSAVAIAIAVIAIILVAVGVSMLGASGLSELQNLYQ